ncbi:hypothetical protein PYCCODRAFT_801349 [Trametes coccinea BRFM310]|uniref:Uncharacterized protein n=1 Tax=Trametes coccinea (strain BRFM310) TaxID=1353009 RepID=A0A1Y2IEZ4_TRAC3|nr:hypothetical protein PYCCODRAFT_801349 [Trametes coccinea BRFM310]
MLARAGGGSAWSRIVLTIIASVLSQLFEFSSTPLDVDRLTACIVMSLVPRAPSAVVKPSANIYGASCMASYIKQTRIHRTVGETYQWTPSTGTKRTSSSSSDEPPADDPDQHASYLRARVVPAQRREVALVGCRAAISGLSALGSLGAAEGVRENGVGKGIVRDGMESIGWVGGMGWDETRMARREMCAQEVYSAGRS